MNSSFPHPDWQERSIQLFGTETHSLLKKAHVLVVGMGGVGSMAAEMICRSGVSAMTIIDGDTIQASNLNRQLPATHSNLGRSKVEVMGERLMDINPGLELHPVNEFLKEERIPQLVKGSFDFVVDAIDTLTPKIDLIYHCTQQKLPLASSMGSGGKLDPSQVKVADFGETYNCRLAYLLRKKLRKMDVHGGFRVVFSTEQVEKRMVLPVEDEPFKKSSLGTSSYIPAIFGCFLASIVVRDLVEATSS